MEDDRREDDSQGWIDLALEVIGGILELIGELGSS